MLKCSQLTSGISFPAPPRSGAASLAALLCITLMTAVIVFSWFPRPASASPSSFLPPATDDAPFSADLDALGLGRHDPLHTGKDALLTIFYNAGTLGELHPCPT